MILEGNQRGGGRNLALHLMKDENDHVQIHDMRGFVATDLIGAFNEAYAVSRGTKCTQYLYSLSLNPPPTELVETDIFDAAIERVEDALGLTGQPRAIVFHEKDGRRHAHCVWSRIDADQMKAVQLSCTKRKLMTISRELYLEHCWQMPRGFVQSEVRDPRNFSLAEWQQAKRTGKDARAIKTALQDAWAISDGKTALASALEERGFRLARGDRRSFVAVDATGEVYSLPRWIGINTKAVCDKLGSEDDLPSVTDVRAELANDVRRRSDRLKGELLADLRSRNSDLRRQRAAMIERHRETRRQLLRKMEQRKWEEARIRQARFRSGLKGLWDWARGESSRIQKRNEAEALAAKKRDREELDAMIFSQLLERRRLIDLRQELAQAFAQQRTELRDDVRAIEELARADANELRRRRSRRFER